MTYISTILADGAVGLYVMGESAFASPAADQAGNQNGVYQNSGGLTFGQTGIPGGGGATAVLFTASGSPYISVADVAAQQLGDVLTLEAWIKTSTHNNNEISVALTGGNGYEWYIDTSGRIVANRYNAGTIATSTVAVPSDGAFHHVVWTKNGATTKIYIDGVDVTGTVTNQTLATNGAGFRIGRGNAYNNSFDGTMAMYAMYPTALSGATVLAHYNLGAPASGNPTLSGTPVVGQTLSCSTGGIGSPTYQWKRDNHGGGTYSNISGATSSTYTLVNADDACRVKCTVVSTDSGNSFLISEPIPVNTAVPVVSMQGGAPVAVGNVAQVTTGTWSNLGGFSSSFAYQWYRGPSAISGATAATYLLVSADNGSAITCVVTATNTGGPAAKQSPNAVAPTVLGQGWTRAAQPLMAPAGGWEQTALQEPTVLVDGSFYKMWYSGGWTVEAIGYATCPIASDPTVAANWTKYGSNPVLGGGGSGGWGRSHVVKVGSTYYMYYSKQVVSGSLYVRTSTDGITWTGEQVAIANNQVGFMTGWANNYVWNEGGSTWKMLVEGSSGGTPPWVICYATSTDGLTWTVQGTGPLLSLQPVGGYSYSGPWLARGGAKIGGLYRLWYHAGGGVNSDVYYATSPDAVNWTLGGVQLLHDSSVYEAQQVADPCLVENGGSIYLFTDGTDNANSASYLNASSFPGTLEQFLGISTATPIISGNPVVGQTLSCSTGGIGSPTYQWKRDALGNGTYSNISGATSSTYTLVDADDACHIKCTVVSTDSNITALVTEPIPTITSAPTVSMVSGSPVVGGVVQSTSGSWTHLAGTVATYAYQWYRGATAIIGATASSYTLVSADLNQTITSKVTATNSGGASVAAQSSNSVTVTTSSGSSLIPADSEVPWGAKFRQLWRVSHNDDGSEIAPGGGGGGSIGTVVGGGAWSSALASATTLSGSSIALTSPLPAAFAGTTFWVVIDAYTPNAEVRPASQGSDSLHIAVDLADTGNFARTHPAGAIVLVAQEGLWAPWFGVKQNFLSNRTGQVAAMNAMFTQATKLGFGYHAPCFLGPGLWQMDAATIDMKGCPFDLKGGSLNWVGNDAGIGQAALVNGSPVNGSIIGPAAATSKVGGTLGVDPGCMDGLHITDYAGVSRMYVSGFRNGILESGFNHATMRDTAIANCYYGIYRSGGFTFGDNKYDRININGCRLACFAVASGQRMAADIFYDSHFYGAPVAFYAEPGGSVSPTLMRSSIEAIGNAAFYTKSTAGIGAGSLDGSTTVIGWDNGNYGISSLQGPAVFVNDSGNDCPLTVGGDFSGWPQPTNEYVNGIVPFMIGPNRWLCRGWNLTNLGMGNPWKAGKTLSLGPSVADLTYPSKIYVSSTEAYGDGTIAGTQSPGTISRGALLGPGFAIYATAGGPIGGVALEPDPNLAGVVGMYCVLVRGVCHINVFSGNSIAAGSWLKADASHNGMVVAASSYSDGPIVGWAAAAAGAAPSSFYGSTKTVAAVLTF